MMLGLQEYYNIELSHSIIFSLDVILETLCMVFLSANFIVCVIIHLFSEVIMFRKRNKFLHELEDKLKIEIKDNGPGIDESIKDCIYELGITTKPGQRGIGMYIVKKIVEEAEGEIKFEVDNGTSWFISIPMKRGEVSDRSSDN